jgi:cyclic peptide transporter
MIGERIMALMTGEQLPAKADPGDGGDRVYSILSIIIVLYVLFFLGYLVMVAAETGRGKRHFAGFSLVGLRKSLLSLAMIAPFLYGLFILPAAMAGFSWTSIFAWTPQSFRALIYLLLAAVAVSYLAYFAGRAFPEKNAFRRMAPRILLMSILSGLSNMFIILLVTTAIHSEIPLKYLVFYYLLAVSVYLLGARFVQVNLVKYTRGAICELRITLIEKIFSTSCQEFEKMDRGRIYSALVNDVETFGGSADQVIALITNVFTALGAGIYLASIAFWTAMLTILLVVTIAALFFVVSKHTEIYFEQARDTQNVLMRLINGMIDGFKEISLHRKKKMEYKADIESVVHTYKRKTSIAGIKFANAFVVGESLLVFILGVVVFAIPKLFSDIAADTIMSFVIILLYLIGPVNTILRSVPAIMQIRIAWTRIQQFIKDIPATLDLSVVPEPRSMKASSLRAESVTFQYEKDGEQDGFAVGPIDFEVRAGEILFIIGGNGSGKTTLAKLLTGLYKPDGGRLLINDRVVDNERLSEYFSAVFSPAHLFEKLYSVDIEAKAVEADSYLKLLDLDGKVQIRNNEYSTIRLSGGQRKRLALLQCYLEDCPIYLFDEWAADQDPGYRRFFYRTLLPEMRRSGKIVIAITHDDHYFDVADRVMRMEEGRLVAYDGDFLFTSGHDVFKS